MPILVCFEISFRLNSSFKGVKKFFLIELNRANFFLEECGTLIDDWCNETCKTHSPGKACKNIHKLPTYHNVTNVNSKLPK